MIKTTGWKKGKNEIKCKNSHHLLSKLKEGEKKKEFSVKIDFSINDKMEIKPLD